MTVVLASLGVCACSSSDMPSPPSPQDYLDARAEMEAEVRAARADALQSAVASGTVVTRTFDVYYERHTGFWFNPPGPRDERFRPDFEGETLSQFAYQWSLLEGGFRLDQRLVCVCTGIEWRWYGNPQFLVREAELRWVDRTPATRSSSTPEP